MPENPSNWYPVDQYKYGTPKESPFGENIHSPASRTIPSPFAGCWYFGDETAPDVVLKENEVFRNGDHQPVVAVRTIPPEEPEEYDRQIAVVTQAIDVGGWVYSLHYFGLTPDGNQMVDLESMDMVWVRK